MSDRRLTLAEFKRTENVVQTNNNSRKRVPLLEAQARVEALAPGVFDTSEAREAALREGDTAALFEEDYGVELRSALPLLKAENRRQNFKRFTEFFERALIIELDGEDPLEVIIDLAIGLAGRNTLTPQTSTYDFLNNNYVGQIEAYVAQLSPGIREFIVALSEIISANAFVSRADVIAVYRSTKYALENGLDETLDYQEVNRNVSVNGDFYDLFFEAAFKDRALRQFWKLEYYRVINQMSDEFKDQIDSDNVETALYTDVNGDVFRLPVLGTVIIGGGPLAGYASTMISPLSEVTLISNRANPNPWNSRPIFPNSDSKDGNLNDLRGPLLNSTSNPIGPFQDAGSMTADQGQDTEDSLEVSCADGKTRFYGSGPDTIGDSSDVNSAGAFDKYLLELDYIPSESIAMVNAIKTSGNLEQYTLGVFEDRKTFGRRYFLIRKLFIAGGPGEEEKSPISSPLKQDADGILLRNERTGEVYTYAEYEKVKLENSIAAAREALAAQRITIETARIYQPKVLSYFDIEKMIEFWVYDLKFSEVNFPLDYLFDPKNDIIIAGGGDTGLVIAELIRKLCPKGYLPKRISDLLDAYPKILITGAKFSKETDIRRRYRRLLQTGARNLADRLVGLEGLSFIDFPDATFSFQSALDEYVDPFEQYDSGRITISSNGGFIETCVDYTTIPIAKGGGLSIRSENGNVFEAVKVLQVTAINEDLEEQSGDKALSVPGVRIVLEGAQGEKYILEVFPEVKVYTDTRKAVFVDEVETKEPRRRNRGKRLAVTLQDGLITSTVEADIVITATGITPLDFKSIMGGFRETLTDFKFRPNRESIGRFITILGSLNGFKLGGFDSDLREIIELLAKENTAALWVWGTLLELGLWDEIYTGVEISKDKVDSLFEQLDKTSLIDSRDRIQVRSVLLKIFGSGYFAPQINPFNANQNEGFDNYAEREFGGEDLNDSSIEQ